MKYCPICKVNINKNLTNCPLCGAYLDETGGKPFDRYTQEIEPNIQYPTPDFKPKYEYLKTKNNLVIMLGVLICIVLNVLINSTYNVKSLWSVYVAIGATFAILCVFRPIANKSKVYMQIFCDIPVFTLLAVAFELVTTDFTSAEICVKYLLPSVYIAAIILIDFMIIFTRKQHTSGYYSALLYTTFFAILPQLFVWIFGMYSGWLSFAEFFFALLNFGVVFIISYKHIKEEYIRKLNL